MLVLSRRVEQGIVFPQLGITLRILQIRGKIAKVAIVAPACIQVLRDEIAAQHERDEDALPAKVAATDSDQEHLRRNQLNLLQLRVDAIQSRIDHGDVEAAEGMLQSLLKGRFSLHAHTPKSTTRLSPSSADAPIRLLVVEDSDNERGLMVYLLASQGFVVRVARDGNEAFQQLNSGGSVPDFILMDIQMPLADGAETLRRLRRDPRFASVPVFAVTGSPRRTEEEPATGGWDGWFQKPVDVASLVARIQDEYITRKPVSSSVSV